MRLDDAVTYFLGEWPSEGATDDTVRTYAGQLKWLVQFAAERHKVQLADLTPQLLRAAVTARTAPAPGRSINHKGGEQSAKSLVYATKRLARWLLAQGVPVADLSSVKAPRPPEHVQLRVREHEFKALEAAILQRLVSSDRRVPRVAIARDLALIYMLADTGLRAVEVCLMEVRSVDFETGSIIIRGKGKKDRALSILDPDDPNGGVTLRLLADWIDIRAQIHGAADHQMLWVSMQGRPLNREQLRKVLARICRAAGLPENRPPHTFRRAAFTEGYLESPNSIRVLASRMGWSPKSSHMIDVYTRGVEIELARTTPVVSVSARWHASDERRPTIRSVIARETTLQRAPNRPIPISGVDPRAGDEKRPGPAQPAKGRQEPGRLPNPRTGRHLKRNG